MENMIPEKRRAERFDLVFPVRLQSSGIENLDLFTRDISSKGAFVRTAAPLDAGVKVELSVAFPTGEMYFNVVGKIVRVDKDGMAVQFDRPGLVSASETIH